MFSLLKYLFNRVQTAVSTTWIRDSTYLRQVGFLTGCFSGNLLAFGFNDLCISLFQAFFNGTCYIADLPAAVDEMVERSRFVSTHLSNTRRLLPYQFNIEKVNIDNPSSFDKYFRAKKRCFSYFSQYHWKKPLRWIKYSRRNLWSSILSSPIVSIS